MGLNCSNRIMFLFSLKAYYMMEPKISKHVGIAIASVTIKNHNNEPAKVDYSM